MAIKKITNKKQIAEGQTAYELNNTIAYYSFTDTSFSVFNSFEDALDFNLYGGEVIVAVAEFDSKEELDGFLEDCEICTVCGKVCFPDDECYSDHDTGDACCTECCFYDESNDMYHKGTIEKAYYALLQKVENKTTFTIQQYDNHFSDMCAEFGIFDDRDTAIEAMMNGFEKLYPGFKEDVQENGHNQWVTDEFEFGVTIAELSVNNTFGEM